ncbi:MAG: tetratricopeptide repeat protein [Opitutus sp.]|nr:tetratricopeptide repeat protein [Opitutus sp.]
MKSARRPEVRQGAVAGPPVQSEPWQLSDRWACFLIFAVTLVAYFPALSGGFIWDDAGHVTRGDLRSLAGLGRIWFEVGATQQYYPFLHTAFWLEHHVIGDSAAGYHLINLLLHATAACLAGILLRRLSVPGAWLAALLFALHPVAVESVAWISEQKNTLSAVLYLCAALAWLRYDQQQRRSAYVWATILFVLALLTKTVTATLPAALLVIAWWRRGTIDWRRDVRPLLSWFALSAVAGVTTAWFERNLIGAEGTHFDLDPLQRGLLAGRTIWFYLAKLFWPSNLMFVYPRWTIDAGAWWQYLYPLSVLALLAALWRYREQSRGPLAALLFFAGTLFPALGFVNVFPFIFSFVADHFQYLASLGVFALVAAGLTMASLRWPRWAGRALAGVILVGIGTLTWSQTQVYRDNVTLFEDTLRRNPDAWMAHHNLGTVLVGARRAAEAIPHFEQTLRLRPDYAEGESNLGDSLTRVGRATEALPHLERALKLQPRYAEAHNNLGVALMAVGRREEGMAKFSEALKLRAHYPVAHFNLGLALASSGRPADAVAYFQEAVRQQPDYAEAELGWGIALTLTGRFSEAVAHFERALHLEPDSADAHNKFGRALAANGRFDDAISHYRQAIEFTPTMAEAHLNLSAALRRTGRLEEAAQHLSEAQRL